MSSVSELSSSDRDNSPLPFLHLIETLKHLPRSKWLGSIKTPESVASHSLRLAFLGAFAPEGLDRLRCMFIGLCHDLAEAVVGDIPPTAQVTRERVNKLERFGFRYISELVKPCNPTLATDIVEAWLDFEEQRTAEGRWMREMDRFEALVQAHEYEQRTHGRTNVHELEALADDIVSSDARRWLGALCQERKDHFARRKRRLPAIFIAGDTHIADKHGFALAKELGISYTSIDAILREKAADSEFRFSGFITECLNEDVQVPSCLAVELLQDKLEQLASKSDGQELNMVLVCGFPLSLEQLTEFERKVQVSNYTILLHRFSERENGDCGSLTQGTWRAVGERKTILCDHLKSMGEYFKELSCDTTDEQIYDSIKVTVQGFIEHSKEMRC